MFNRFPQSVNDFYLAEAFFPGYRFFNPPRNRGRVSVPGFVLKLKLPIALKLKLPIA